VNSYIPNRHWCKCALAYRNHNKLISKISLKEKGIEGGFYPTKIDKKAKCVYCGNEAIPEENFLQTSLEDLYECHVDFILGDI